MILASEDLAGLRGRPIAMVDGGFDPLHVGHLAYFEEARKLGVPVLCNMRPDRYLREAKGRPPLLPEAQRAKLIDSLKTIDYVYVCHESTADMLERVRPKFYVKGADWRERGLPRAEVDICAAHGVEIVFLNTVLDSSTSISQRYRHGPEGGSSMDVDRFEQLVLSQRQVASQAYDKDYYVGEWRAEGNDYSLETRRRIEGKNPQNIKDVFQPKRVLDLGCANGALMHLLGEIGVECHGIDYSEGAKSAATPEVRDRIHIGSVTEYQDLGLDFDLVICRELLEHLTVLQIRQAVQNMARLTSRFVYVTTRFHPEPKSLLDVTDDRTTDPTHITVLNKDFLRTMFVLEGMKRRADLEDRLDWKKYGRVLVYEKLPA